MKPQYYLWPLLILHSSLASAAPMIQQGKTTPATSPNKFLLNGNSAQRNGVRQRTPSSEQSSEQLEFSGSSKKVLLLPEVGMTSLTYNETGITTFTSLLVSLKAGLTYSLIPKRLDLYASGTYWGLGLSGNKPGIGLTMLWANAGAGYTYSFGRLSLGLKVGAYYTTMIVTNSAFGISGLSGASISPIIMWAIGSRHEIGLYYKYAPVLSTSGSGNSASAMGLLYSYTLRNMDKIQFSVDSSNLNLRLAATAGPSIISSGTVSGSVSYTGFSLGS